jgi:hypothetical protein
MVNLDSGTEMAMAMVSVWEIRGLELGSYGV